MQQFDKFVKLMMLTTSLNDNEALSALRKATAILASLNLNWEEFLNIGVNHAISPSQETVHTEASIDDMLEDLLLEVQGSFRDFVESVNEWYKRKGYLTDKQHSAIKKAWDKRREKGPIHRAWSSV